MDHRGVTGDRSAPPSPAHDVIAQLLTERDHILAVCRTLSADQWAAPSDCAGWSVQDTIAHLGSLAHGFVVPWTLKLARDGEVMNEKMVAARRGRSASDVLAEFETWSERATRLLRTLQRPVLGNLPLVLPGIGKQPARLMANAGLFDHYLHLRHDLLAPTGPIEQEVPEASAGAIRSILAWIFAGLPHMCRRNLEWLGEPVALDVTGAGGGVWAVSRVGRGKLTVTSGDCGATSRVTTNALEFIVWSTRRRSWRDYAVTLDGGASERFCDSLHIT